MIGMFGARDWVAVMVIAGCTLVETALLDGLAVQNLNIVIGYLKKSRRISTRIPNLAMT